MVTGANRGIGRAIAVELARAGAAVAVSARNAASLEQVKAQIEAEGGRCSAIAADVTQEESLVALAAAVEESLGPAHTIVANAGITGPTRVLHEISLSEWRDCVATDLDGVFLTFKAFLPRLIERRSGSLIAISSMTGKRPLPGRTPYAAAKMGVIGLCRTLAMEVGPYGIRVNSVCPGAVTGPRLTDVIRKQAQLQNIDEDSVRRQFTENSALRRLIEPESVGHACVFLASDAAASVTGEDLNVSAGEVMY